MAGVGSSAADDLDTIAAKAVETLQRGSRSARHERRGPDVEQAADETLLPRHRHRCEPK
jgi:hypothetical protein